MAAQSDHDCKSSPVYDPDRAMLQLLRAQYVGFSPPNLPPANAQHTPPTTANSSNTSTHRSPVTFDPAATQENVRRPAREVVPGLPRSQTLKRQHSERREHLTPVDMPPEERRALSSEIKSPFSLATSGRDDVAHSFATPSAFGSTFDHYSDLAFSATSSPRPIEEEPEDYEDEPPRKAPIPVPPPKLQPGVTLIPGTNLPDTTGMPRDEFEALIQNELENVWILNLSMHFRDRSKREKFFVTYRERDTLWRRVTISLDYRNAPLDSLEGELANMKFQRDKSAKIYEAIRDSLPDIQFYDTATNLKLQTSEGRLHVHVVEDGNEKIEFPRVELLQHLNCMMVKEGDLVFDSHMSGFVYKVRVNGEILVKKEIPGSETVEEFLYEIHALHSLQDSDYVIRFRGLVTDDDNEVVKALLLDYCPKGALIDRIYDDCKTTYLGIPWRKRERWARQIIHGVADIHESGFVQGDLTLANVVLDEKENAKIIDVNRRGCPVGWEPPEAKPLVDTNQRLSLYIGVKSDLFQLGMLLWALAMEEDEPEIQGRPLLLGPEVNIPDWYRQITEICLSHDPRSRLQAAQLLTMIPDPSFTPAYSRIASRPAVEHCESPRELSGESAPSTEAKNEAAFYPQRGRSPPSPMPSDSSRQQKTGWAANLPVAASYDDMAAKAKSYLDASRNRNSMPTPEYESLAQQQQQQQQQQEQKQSPLQKHSPMQQQSPRQHPPQQQSPRKDLPQQQSPRQDPPQQQSPRQHPPQQQSPRQPFQQQSPRQQPRQFQQQYQPHRHSPLQSSFIPPKPYDTERSFLDDASKASITPPATFATMPPPPPKQSTTYLNSADSGIFMRSYSEETVAYPTSPSKSKDLAQRINEELLEDLERNGAAKSALQAIFGLRESLPVIPKESTMDANHPAISRDAVQNGNHSAGHMDSLINGQHVAMPTAKSNNESHSNIPPDNVNKSYSTPRDKSTNGDRSVPRDKPVNGNHPIPHNDFVNNNHSIPRDKPINDNHSIPRDNSVNNSHSMAREKTMNDKHSVPRDSSVNTNHSLAQEKPMNDSHSFPRDKSTNGNYPAMPSETLMNKNHSSIPGDNMNSNHAMALDKLSNHSHSIPQDKPSSDDPISQDKPSSNEHYTSQKQATHYNHSVPQEKPLNNHHSSRDHPVNESYSAMPSDKSTHDQDPIPQAKLVNEYQATLPPAQFGSDLSTPSQEKFTNGGSFNFPRDRLINGDHSAQAKPVNEYFNIPQAVMNSDSHTTQDVNIDDNASVAASFISRTSSPDGDLEGGAQLGRSDTAFSAVDTHFARPAYPMSSKQPLTTIIDTPVTTLDQHTMHHRPNGTLPGLGPGHGIAAPLLADLNPDIHFDSALWPDATRRFMTGAKS
ncbi:hypothetical protein PWT90_01602 [Aphanocladium album]|nr:hypothetical protein PWT90_01602 [Aphanocladium album]